MIDDDYIRYLKEQTDEIKKLNESASVIINILKAIQGLLVILIIILIF